MALFSPVSGTMSERVASPAMSSIHFSKPSLKAVGNKIFLPAELASLKQSSAAKTLLPTASFSDAKIAIPSSPAYFINHCTNLKTTPAPHNIFSGYSSTFGFKIA